jgi:hypothetical protein
LIRLCTDLGLKEAGDYASDLRKLEHSQSEASSQENNNKRTGTSKKRRQFFYCIFLMTSQFFYIFFFSTFQGVTYSSGRGSRLSSAASGIDAILKSQPTSAESLSNKPTTSSYQTTQIGIEAYKL